MSDGLPRVEKSTRLVITEESLGDPEPALSRTGSAPIADTVQTPPTAQTQAQSEAGSHVGALAVNGTAPGSGPGGQLPALAPSSKPVVASQRSFCSACGSPIDPRAMICPRCGVAAAGAVAATATMAALTIRHKSAGTAILCSLFLPGAGQMYVGRTGRGIAFFCAAVVSYLLIIALIGLILVPIVAIWAAVDANKLANEYNTQLLAGIPPA